jgi:hypothetical protein
MDLPPDVEFHEDIRLFVYRPRGSLNEPGVNKVISVLGELEAALKEPFNRFFDTSETNEVDLNFRFVTHASLFRRLTYAHGPDVKSAILATDATITHYARLLAVLTQGSPIHTRIFQARSEAAKWLGVPVERLEPVAQKKNS